MGKIYQITINTYTQWPQTIPNSLKIDQMDVKYTNISIAKPSKISPNRDFWFENIPSGNPDPGSFFCNGQHPNLFSAGEAAEWWKRLFWG
jgi:hypothetical protein